MKRMIPVLLAALILLMLGACGKTDVPTTGPLTAPEYTTELTGVVVRFKNDTVMLFTEDNGPVVLGGEMNLEGLNTGDRLTVYCDGIEESYPARTVVKEMLLNTEKEPAEPDEEMLKKVLALGYELEK